MSFVRPSFTNGPISEEVMDFPIPHVTMSDMNHPRQPGGVNLEKIKEMPDEGPPPEIAAKYKIEITYRETRKLNGPSVCAMTVWESGKRFHGGGDQSMFWCLNPKNKDEGCGGLIPDDHVRGGMALCPHCKRMINQAFLPVERVGYFSVGPLANEITRVFRHLGSNADVYLKFHSADTAGMTRLRADGKEYREAAIYTLSRIMQDTVGGADLTKRFEAFLSA